MRPHILLIAITIALVAGPSAQAETASPTGHGGAHAEQSPTEGAVMTEATLNAVDGDTANVTHPPIPAIGWPGMTMDLKLLDGASLGDAKPGDKVMLELQKGADGLYGIKSVAKP